jgi:transcriptional antiterminator RfaH
METRQTPTSTQAGFRKELAWFCVRSQPKREHIAALNLARLYHLEIFNPRMRSRKITRRGPVWFVENLFPNYLFARFVLATQLDDVKFTPGVSHVVQFGGRYAAIPQNIIEELRQNFGPSELQLSAELPSEGDAVTITGKVLDGFRAVVLRVMPAKQRVQVLLEMLGSPSLVELNLASIVPERSPLPSRLLYRPAGS